MNKKISTQQFAFLLFFLLQGSALVYIPEASAGRDAWISNIIASLFGLYILFAFLDIQSTFPGFSVLKVSELALGKVAGKSLNLLFIGFIFMVGIRYLYEQVIIMNMIYQNTPDVLFQSVLILTAAWGVYKGMINIARIAELFIWVAVFIIILFFVITYNLLNPINLTPVLSDIKPVIAGAFYGFESYAELSLLAFFLPFVTDLAEKKRLVYHWYFFAVIILLIKNLENIMILGPEVAMASRIPLYDVHRFINLANFLQRVELFFFFLVVVIGFITLSIAYKSLLLGLKEIFSLRQYRPLILPVALLLISLTNYMFPSDMEYLQEASKNLPLLTVPFYLLYPSIILLAVKLREKHIREQLKLISINA